MYALYELAILSVRIVQKRREAKLAAQEAELSGSSSE
jgi:sec-independent protein translocase protein TatC